MLISDSYRAMQRQMHAEQSTYGTSGANNIDMIRKVCSWGRKRVLDYGCGKGKMAEALGPAYRVTGYDPCVDGLDEPPDPHPVVVCSNVLEHIEPEYIDDVLRDIRRVTQQTALLLIHTRAAVAVLPDGRNAHLIQQPREWWEERIVAAGFHIMEAGDGLDGKGEKLGCFAECLPC